MLVRRFSTAAAIAVAAVGVLATSTAAAAADSKCVALVVDFSHIGGSVSSACVTVPTSATGSDVLARHHKVTFDPRYGDNFICAIDGVPAGGCHSTDDTHYWVYYHRAPGSSAWHVSQEGAGTYKPANTSTEGWVYDNGDSSAPAPRDVPYKSICTSPPPTSTPSPSPTHTRVTTASPASAATVTHRPASHRSSMPAIVATTSTATPTASPSVIAPHTLAVAVHRSRAHRVPLALIVALVAAAVLGVAAFVRLRRSSG